MVLNAQVEQWKSIAGFEGMYEVSNLGRVRSLTRPVNTRGNSLASKPGLLLKPHDNPDGDGYLYVNLSRDGKALTRRVHRLVAQAFIPNPEGKPEVNHKNGKQKHNNRVTNLEWATRSENAQHAVRTGLFKDSRGEKHHGAKVTEEQVIKMRHLVVQGVPRKALQDMFDLSESQVQRIVTHESWSHVA